MQVSRNSAVEDISKGVGPGGQPNYVTCPFYFQEKYEKLNTIVGKLTEFIF